MELSGGFSAHFRFVFQGLRPFRPVRADASSGRAARGTGKLVERFGDRLALTCSMTMSASRRTFCSESVWRNAARKSFLIIAAGVSSIG
jgi:hypothetical protein